MKTWTKEMIIKLWGWFRFKFLAKTYIVVDPTYGSDRGCVIWCKLHKGEYKIVSIEAVKGE